MPPSNPRLTPIIKVGLESVEIATQKNVNKEKINENEVCEGSINEIKQLIKVYFEEKYLRYLKDKHNGFINAHVHQFFEYLCNTCGNMTDLDLKKNEEKIKKSCNQE